MKKIITMQDLDCANCAMKMENAISKLDGVHQVQVNFLLQKMTLDIDENNTNEIITQIKKICKKIEPECVLKV